jgi:hypothetical protein
VRPPRTNPPQTLPHRWRQRRELVDVDVRGNWTRTYDGKRLRYYYRGVRVPWLAWVMGF